jgi:hypothetical protein
VIIIFTNDILGDPVLAEALMNLENWHPIFGPIVEDIGNTIIDAWMLYWMIHGTWYGLNLMWQVLVTISNNVPDEKLVPDEKSNSAKLLAIAVVSFFIYLATK